MKLRILVFIAFVLARLGGQAGLLAQELPDSLYLPAAHADFALPKPENLKVELPSKLQDFKLPEAELNYAKRRSTTELYRGFLPQYKQFDFNPNLNLRAESRHIQSPTMQVDMARMSLNWQPNERLLFSAQSTMALGQDLLVGVNKDYGFGVAMQASLAKNLGATASANWNSGFGFAPQANLGAALHYKPMDRLQINTGMRYYTANWAGQNGQVLRVNTDFKLELVDNLFLRGFGGYSIYNKQSHYNPMLPPLANYGGALELRLSDRFGLGVGMEREYNIWTRSWEEHYFAYPIFYGDK